MRNIKNLTINKAVIHILDNSMDKPILNQKELYLTDDTLDFIGKHISKASADEEARYAKFDLNNDIYEICRQGIYEGENFLEISNILAEKLFNISKPTGLIPSGDLLVVKFECEYGKMLGILKMTYNKAFIHHIDYEDDKTVVDIKSKYIALPGTVQKLQKCAFINLEGDDGEIFVINRPTKNEKDAKNNELFISEFLKCSFVDDKRQITKEFINNSEKWIRENLSDDADKAEQLRRVVVESLRNDDEIDIKDIAGYINDKTLSDEFIQSIKEKTKTEKIKVDRDYVSKKLNRRKIKVDKDIEINVSSEAYNDINRFQVKRNGDGTVDIIIRQIRNYFEKK